MRSAKLTVCIAGAFACPFTSGLSRILARHTCAHRVDELMAILAQLEAPAEAA